MGHGRVTLVIGGTRSGKSRHAQQLAEAAAGPLLFVATGQPFDDEMRERIARHRADRGERWHTREAPLLLPQAIAAATGPVLVDCLTLWTSNLLLAGEALAPNLDQLDHSLATTRAEVVLVTGEVGMGVVPETPLGRRFRDMAGTVNQRVAARADRVHLVVAGLVSVLK